MSIAFKPIRDNVLVKRLEEAESKTAAGIIIPDTAKEKPSQGKVIVVGPGKKNKNGEIIPLSVKKGDKIIFEKWSGREIKIDGEEYIVMNEDEILAVIED